MRRRWLFVREFKRLQGGHLKVFDYFRHTAALFGVPPALYQTPGSEAVADNPWSGAGIASVRAPVAVDAAFLAGEDWRVAEAAGFDLSQVPIVNLLQGFAHCAPGSARFGFLSRPAVRICVSAELAEAVRATGQCTVEIHVVPAGIDVAALSAWGREPRDIDILVAGMKHPAMAAALGTRLREARPSARIEVLDAPLPRTCFLERLGRARAAVLLPRPVEGFFLPPLEAMAMGTVAVTVDAIGNRQFCRHRENCLLAPSDPAALARAALQALDDDALALHLQRAGRDCATRHDLAHERQAYGEILWRVGWLPRTAAAVVGTDMAQHAAS